MTTQQTTLYRDKQNAKLMGVCSGIADYTGVNALWVRLAALILAFSTGFVIPLYFVAGLLLGDFVAAIAIAARSWQRAPRATFAELLLFAALFVYWWSGYQWPAYAQFEALVLLTAVGTAAGRFGAHTRRSMTVSGWN